LPQSIALNRRVGGTERRIERVASGLCAVGYGAALFSGIALSEERELLQMLPGAPV